MSQPSPLTLVVIPAVSAILATLLTIMLTPTLQHYFWKRQRRDDLRFAAANEVNRVASEFIAGYLEAERNKTKYVPDVTLFQALHALRGQVKQLFSDAAFMAFARFESAIGPNLEKVPGEGVGSLEEYLRRRDAALRAMYRDLGIVDRGSES